MIREKVRTQDNKLIIDIPEEYIGKNLEVLIFSENEIQKPKSGKNIEREKLLKEFERISKNISILEE